MGNINQQKKFAVVKKIMDIVYSMTITESLVGITLYHKHLGSKYICITTLTGHTDFVRCPQFQKEFLLSVQDDTTSTIWNITMGTLLHTVTHHTKDVYSVKFRLVWLPNLHTKAVCTIHILKWNCD